MARQTIFYSWQSDSPASTNRDFIERALQKVLTELNADAAVFDAERPNGLELDRDTKNVPGTPPIADTILKKITSAAAVVPDLTFIGKSQTAAGSEPRMLANPNVLIEYGYALAVLGHGRMVPVMNTHYGRPTPTSMPFDMRHLRHPVTYLLPPEASGDQKSAIMAKLVADLKERLEQVFRLAPARKQEQDATGSKKALVLPATMSGGSNLDCPGHNVNVTVPLGPKAFVYLIPSSLDYELDSPYDCMRALTDGQVRPLGWQYAAGWGFDRNREGGCVYEVQDGCLVRIAQLFQSGALYCADHRLVNPWFPSPPDPSDEEHMLVRAELFEGSISTVLGWYLVFYKNVLRATPPMQIAIGVTGVNNFRLGLPTGFVNPRDMCSQRGERILHDDFVFTRRVDALDAPMLDILESCFKKLWKAFGLERPNIPIKVEP